MLQINKGYVLAESERCLVSGKRSKIDVLQTHHAICLCFSTGTLRILPSTRKNGSYTLVAALLATVSRGMRYGCAWKGSFLNVSFVCGGAWLSVCALSASITLMGSCTTHRC